MQRALSAFAAVFLGIALASGSIQLGPVTIPQSTPAGVLIAVAGGLYLMATRRGSGRRDPATR